MDTLREVGLEVEDKTALVFGTGGAARTVAFILTWLRAREVWVAGRNVGRAREIVAKFGGRGVDLDLLAELPLPAALVVNATSVSSPEESEELARRVAALSLRGCELILDLNYGRRRNFWREKAAREGTRFVDGLTPLAFQARRTLELWTGVKVPPQEFLEVLNSEALLRPPAGAP
jgi:shikimate dehydrogenase